MTSEDSKLSEDNLPRSIGTDSRPRNHLAASLRGFGPAGIIAILLILLSGNVFIGNLAFPIGALLVLLWTRMSETRWSEIGYVRPKNWIVSSALGITFGIAFKFLMKAIVMPLLGADPINHAYHYLAGNRTLLPTAVWAMFVAGFGEETVFRGYLFERCCCKNSNRYSYLWLVRTGSLYESGNRWR
jgi:membrane protease YdiL (CAAX protease family)